MILISENRAPETCIQKLCGLFSLLIYLFLKQNLFSNLELTHLAQLAGQRALGILLSLLGMKVQTVKPSFVCELWGPQLRSSCFHNKHFFTNRATSVVSLWGFVGEDLMTEF